MHLDNDTEPSVSHARFESRAPRAAMSARVDLWGRIYVDHWRGEVHPHEYIRDDGKVQRVDSAESYFVAPRIPAEREVLNGLTGRVLDLGCGPGSYARYLEERGVEVTAIDASAGAIAVCRERGCRGAHVAEMDQLPSELAPFDAIICMGNTLGIGQTPEALPRRLAMLRKSTVPGGRLLAALRDPLDTDDPEHLAYHARNRAAGRPPGLTRSRLRYRGELGDWWELWMPTRSELEEAAHRGGWAVSCLHSEGSARLYELTADLAN
jgi:SAM-dependent methyltransferase